MFLHVSSICTRLCAQFECNASMLILAHFGVQLICVSGYHVTHADVYQYVFSQQEESENSVGIYSDIVLLLKNGVWKI